MILKIWKDKFKNSNFKEIRNNDNKIFGYEVIIKQDSYLSDSISEMIHGIVDKKITGIGATSLEIKADRNSIIVVPSKYIAYTKSLDNKELLYVGSPIGNITKNVSKNDIRKYINDPSIINKKIIVVADSLRKVIEVIGKENYSNYFLFIDEIDCYQTDSTFRVNLENVIDYYLEYPENKRALVTATLREFSNPYLNQEIKTIIKYPVLPIRNINLYHTNNPNIATVEAVNLISRIRPVDKILVAYNSITNILNIIDLLSDDLKKECSIICGESSIEAVGKYHTNFKGENLSSRITFMTSSTFRGIDIKEQFHLISVANHLRPHTLLSTTNLTQIAGRCRHKYKIYSETIIYNTEESKEIDLDDYQKALLEDAQSTIELVNNLNKKRNIKIVSWDKMTESLIDNTAVKIGEKFIPVTRKNIYGECAISYLNIDALTEIKYLETWLYSLPQNLKNRLIADGHNIRYRERFFRFTKEQNNSKVSIIEHCKEIKQKRIKVLLNDILDNRQYLDDDYFNELLFKRNNIEELVILCLKILYKYYRIDDLIKVFEEAIPEKRSYTNLYNSLIFKAISSSNPFKIGVLSLFNKNIRIPKAKVHEDLNYVMGTFFNIRIERGNNVFKYLNIFFTWRGRRGKDSFVKIVDNYSCNIKDIQPINYIKEIDISQYFKFLYT